MAVPEQPELSCNRGQVTCLAEGFWLGGWHQGLAHLVIGSEAEAIPAGAVVAAGRVDAELPAAVALAGTFIHV